MDLSCPVCGIKLPPILPCGLAPRYYVSDFGFITGIINGCPYEPEKMRDYVQESDLPRVPKAQKAAMKQLAKETISALDYEDLWTARNRKNYHLDFDAKNRLGIWYAAHSGSLHNPHKSRVRRGKGSRSRGVKSQEG